MHEGTDSVREPKLDVLQNQLDKFKMKDGEGVAEMYLCPKEFNKTSRLEDAK